MTTTQGARIQITGIVQGVGFRPFVYGLAARLALTGWVRNSAAGVEIEVDGPEGVLAIFRRDLHQQAPALARIDQFQFNWQPPQGFTQFEIVSSQSAPEDFLPVSPDVSICSDCLREMFDPANRRYRYPFINCTHCGPRFTIVRDIPYDRPNTTMAAFPMCQDCGREYFDPLNRRFHAQPVACAQCGPQVWLEQAGNVEALARGDMAIQQARSMLLEGKILAIKGLGGFHLACDATNPAAVDTLRQRKLRVDKPFALMLPDAETAARYGVLTPEERAVLESRQRPIVVLRRSPDSAISPQVAPEQDTLGVMLPYTPLHYLLFAAPGNQPPVFDLPPLVMTSGNLSEEPICSDNEEARQHLADLADGFLMNDRPIHTRCDDAVVRMVARPPSPRQTSFASPLPLGEEERSLYPLRRGRGYAPDPIRLPVEAIPLLAAGGELKNTFCLTRGPYAFLSHHIGDLENYETLQAFIHSVEHYEHLFRIQPEAYAYDLHPNYLGTRYALELAARQNLPAVGVQHHHAHIVACMADNGIDGSAPLIGVSFDGSGYGEDGAIWGGEFLIARAADYQRAVHLAYAPLPGGDKAVRQPWRMALSWLAQAGLDWSEDLPPVQYAASLAQNGMDPLPVLRGQLQSGLNAPLTSSLGRLFDAAAALMGVRQVVNYEAQAAIELEAQVEPGEDSCYTLELRQDVLDPAQMFHQIVADWRAGVDVPIMAARLHGGIAKAVLHTCQALRVQTGLKQVALSGGVWQNMILLNQSVNWLQQAGFEIFIHHQVPANDGGLALGQAVSALAKLK